MKVLRLLTLAFIALATTSVTLAGNPGALITDRIDYFNGTLVDGSSSASGLNGSLWIEVDTASNTVVIDNLFGATPAVEGDFMVSDDATFADIDAKFTATGFSFDVANSTTPSGTPGYLVKPGPGGPSMTGTWDSYHLQVFVDGITGTYNAISDSYIYDLADGYPASITGSFVGQFQETAGDLWTLSIPDFVLVDATVYPNSAQLTAIQDNVVPVPGAFLLGGLGVGIVGYARRKRAI